MELWWLDNVTSKSSGLQIKFPVFGVMHLDKSIYRGI